MIWKENQQSQWKKVCFGQYLIYLFHLPLCFRFFHSVLLINQIKINDTKFWLYSVAKCLSKC